MEAIYEESPVSSSGCWWAEAEAFPNTSPLHYNDASPPDSPTLYYNAWNGGGNGIHVKDELLKELEDFGNFGEYDAGNVSPSSSMSPTSLSSNAWTTPALELPHLSPGIPEESVSLVESASPEHELPEDAYTLEFQAILDSLPGSKFELLQEDVVLFQEDSSSDGMEYEDISQSAAESDAEDVSEKILDALLVGNLAQAEGFMRRNDSFLSLSGSTVSAPAIPAARKPSVPVRKPRLGPKTDKALRKKEQNKSAATRYREKKKMEMSLVSLKEEELSEVNADLQKSKDDLEREISIVKKLLKEIIRSKRGKK